MKIGLVGFSGSGKNTVFQWLTGARGPLRIQQGQTGMAKVPDTRLDAISQHFAEENHVRGDRVPRYTGPAHDDRKDNPRRLGILQSAGLVVVLTDSAASDLTRNGKFREEIRRPGNRHEPRRTAETQLPEAAPAKERGCDERNWHCGAVCPRPGSAAPWPVPGRGTACPQFQLLTPQTGNRAGQPRRRRITGQPLSEDLAAMAPRDSGAPVGTGA